MKLYRAKDYNDMSRKAANIISAQIIMKPSCVLGLATGSSPIGTYKQLIEWYNKGDLDFSQVKTANYFMRENLFRHVNIDEANTNIPDGMESDANKEAARYEEIIKGLGGVDLQLLGLGHNGHIGFNEPSDIFPKDTHIVDLQESTIEANKRFFASIDEVPRQAYTMGIGTIMRARKILLIVSGAEKADILHDVICGPVTSKVPASILQLHPDVTIVADEAALSRMGNI